MVHSARNGCRGYFSGQYKLRGLAHLRVYRKPEGLYQDGSLEAGAHGLIFPMIESAERLERPLIFPHTRAGQMAEEWKHRR